MQSQPRQGPLLQASRFFMTFWPRINEIIHYLYHTIFYRKNFPVLRPALAPRVEDL